MHMYVYVSMYLSEIHLIFLTYTLSYVYMSHISMVNLCNYPKAFLYCSEN